jgi:hypothetical protein
MRKFVVFYAYFEDPGAKRNLSFFCDHGVFAEDDRMYVFVVNGNKCTVDIPAYSNVKIIRRNNVGFDFGAWAEGIRSIILSNFDYFVFLNSSVRGPFLPSYVRKKDCFDMFFELIDGKTKLVGTTIVNYIDKNPLCITHVQSMFFVVDKVGLEILRKRHIFTNNTETKKNQVITQREFKVSAAIVNAGYTIDCIAPTSKGRIYSLRGAINKVCMQLAQAPGRLFGKYDLHPLDVVFFKTNRDLAPHVLSKYTDIADHERRTRGTQFPFSNREKTALAWAKSTHSSTWNEHMYFAHWLMCQFSPGIVVDLSSNLHSHIGWSVSSVGEIYKAESQSLGTNDQPQPNNLVDYARKNLGVGGNIRFIDPNDSFDKPIDILLIDGHQTSDTVDAIFSKWAPQVGDSGLILLHGTKDSPQTVGALFGRTKNYHKDELSYGGGLGILCKMQAHIVTIQRYWKSQLENSAKSGTHKQFKV